MQEEQLVSFNGTVMKVGAVAALVLGVAGFVAGNETLQWIVPIFVFLASIGAAVFWPVKGKA